AADRTDGRDLGDDDGIAVGVFAGAGQVIQCPRRGGAVEEPKTGLAGGTGGLESVASILDDEAVPGDGSERIEAVGIAFGWGDEIDHVPGGVDAANAEDVDGPGVKEDEFDISDGIAEGGTAGGGGRTGGVVGIEVDPAGDRILGIIDEAVEALGFRGPA